jgi:hypothetical protein
MEEVFDFGTGTPYTHEDLEILFRGQSAGVIKCNSCTACSWFDEDSEDLCRGPITCVKWMDCGKCCPLTGRLDLIEFERCTHFKVDPVMAN